MGQASSQMLNVRITPSQFQPCPGPETTGWGLPLLRSLAGQQWLHPRGDPGHTFQEQQHHKASRGFSCTCATGLQFLRRGSGRAGSHLQANLKEQLDSLVDSSACGSWTTYYEWHNKQSWKSACKMEQWPDQVMEAFIPGSPYTQFHTPAELLSLWESPALCLCRIAPVQVSDTLRDFKKFVENRIKSLLWILEQKNFHIYA